MSSLVVQTSFIGDVILTTPLIAALHARGPVDVVTTPIGASVLRHDPHIRRLIPYDKRNTDRGMRGFRNMLRQAAPLPGDAPRTAYLAQGSLRSAALALGAQARSRIGFDTSGGKALYTTRVPYRDDWHHARRLLSLASMETAASASESEIRPHVYPGDDDALAVETLLHDMRDPFIALAPGSVWATKRWPYYETLATLLAQDFPIVLIGGPDDSNVAQHITAALPPGRVINAVGELSLLGSAALIARAAAIVTNDSSPQHLASAVGTPTITIFGPTVPAFGFGPLAPNSSTLGHDALTCRPCDRHGPRVCPLGHWRCMREIAPEAVRDAVMVTIAKGKAESSA